RFGTASIVEILPFENVSQIDFAVPAFYSRYVRDIGAVIANTDVFVGADSGMMHLASAAQTPVVRLLSITDPARYGPYGNDSVAIDTKQTVPADCVRSEEHTSELQSRENLECRLLLEINNEGLES